MPALDLDVRIVDVGNSPSQRRVLAEIRVQTATRLPGSVRIDKLDLSLPRGRIEHLGALKSLALPITCKPGDSLSFLYTLLPGLQELLSTAPLPEQLLSLKLSATVSDPTTSLTLAFTLKAFKRVNLAPLITHSTPLALRKPGTYLSLNQPTNPKTGDAGSGPLVTVTISAPPGPFLVGTTMTWSALVVNRSTTRNLNLALVPLTASSARIYPGSDTPRAKSEGTQVQLIKEREFSFLPLAYYTLSGPSIPQSRPPKHGTAPTNPSTFHAPSNYAQLATETLELRLGSLPPGAGATTQLRFSVLKAGIGGVHAIRMVDLDLLIAGDGQGKNSGKEGALRHWTDVKGNMLPDIIAVEKLPVVPSPDAQSQGRSQTREVSEAADSGHDTAGATAVVDADVGAGSDDIDGANADHIHTASDANADEQAAPETTPLDVHADTDVVGSVIPSYEDGTVGFTDIAALQRDDIGAGMGLGLGSVSELPGVEEESEEAVGGHRGAGDDEEGDGERAGNGDDDDDDDARAEEVVEDGEDDDEDNERGARGG